MLHRKHLRCLISAVYSSFFICEQGISHRTSEFFQKDKRTILDANSPEVKSSTVEFFETGVSQRLPTPICYKELNTLPVMLVIYINLSETISKIGENIPKIDSSRAGMTISIIYVFSDR